MHDNVENLYPLLISRFSGEAFLLHPLRKTPKKRFMSYHIDWQRADRIENPRVGGSIPSPGHHF